MGTSVVLLDENMAFQDGALSTEWLIGSGSALLLPDFPVCYLGTMRDAFSATSMGCLSAIAVGWPLV